jgi:hypothetical protein
MSSTMSAIAPQDGVESLMPWLRAERHSSPTWADVWRRLRTSRAALAALRSGFHPAAPNPGSPRFARLPEAAATGEDCLALPARDAQGEIIGIHFLPLGSASPVQVGNHGLIHAEHWDDEDQYPGPVFVVGSVPDALALLTMNLCVLAATEPGDIDLLTERIKGPPSKRGITVVGPPAWAFSTAQKLAATFGRSVYWSGPPEGHKDCRSWLDARLHRMEAAETLEELGEEFAWLAKGRRPADLLPEQLNGEAMPTAAPAPAATLPELPADSPAAQALLGRPSYEQYLSPAALARGVTQREIEVAQMAEWAATQEDKEEAQAWQREVARVSAGVDAEDARTLKDLGISIGDDDELVLPPRARRGTSVAPPVTVSAAQRVPLEVQEMQDTLALLQVEVLGQDEDGAIAIYPRQPGCLRKIGDIGRLSYPALIKFVGLPAAQHVVDGLTPVEGKRTMAQVRCAIALAASSVRLDHANVLGQGIWPADGKIVLVNGGEAAAYNNGALERLSGCQIGQHIVYLTGRSEQWFDFDKMSKLLALAADPAWSQGVLQEAVDLFAHWNWKRKQDARTCALLAACSFVQTLWPWRPEVALAGQSDSGKTTALALLKTLFGRLAFASEKPTEAGIRQHVQQRACIIMVDELEADAGNRQRILELFRTTSQGGQIVRGTSDQKGRSFGLRHIPWIAATESGLTAEADANRFIRLDTMKLPANKRGKLDLPGVSSQRDLGMRLCAVALHHVKRAIGIFQRLKSKRIKGVHGRIVESYSVPASLQAAVEGLDDDKAGKLLETLLAGCGEDMEPTPAHEQLLQAILLAKVPLLDRNQAVLEKTVGQIIKDPGEGRHDALERQGLALADADAGPGKRGPFAERKHLFIATARISETILRGTPWADGKMDLAQLLRRIPGAIPKRGRVGEVKVQGVFIPRTELGLADESDEEDKDNAARKEDPFAGV